MEYGIRELLHDTDAKSVAHIFFNHPQIISLFSKAYQPNTSRRPGIIARSKNLPAYIPAKNFSLALIDIATRGPEPQQNEPRQPFSRSLENVRSNLACIENPAVQRVILSAFDLANGDLLKVQSYLEAWYNGKMDSISSWYKRSTHFIIFGIGLLIAVALNVDAIRLTQHLYMDSALRELIVSGAEKMASDTATGTLHYSKAKDCINPHKVGEVG